jgi:acetyl esterase/lipase
MRCKIHFHYFVLLTVFILSVLSCEKEPIDPNDIGTNPATDTTLLNVEYGSHTRQVYDIYLPANRDTSTPFILMIHGGGWQAGQKEDLNYYMDLIKLKWNRVAIVNMNYRLASNANNIHHDEIMADITSCLNHIKANQSNYHIAGKAGILGASAGAQLAMIYAYKYDTGIKCVGDIFGPSIINDWSWYNSTNVWLGAPMSDILSEYVGQPWDSTAYKAVSPYWNVSSNTQPTIIFHGILDPIVPLYHSQWLHGKLDNLGVPTEYYEYIAFHSFDNTQSDDVINKLVTFFKPYLE